MTNNYKNCKKNVINEIIYNLDTCDILTLYDIRRIIKDTKPMFIRDYIDEYWNNHSEGFRDDLEHELRKLWVCFSGKGAGCYKIETDGEISHFTDIKVNGEDLDIFIMNHGTEFNPCDIAKAIYDIYIGKVVFCHCK